MTKSFIYAFSTLTGTIIGVGFFSLPYIASKVGFWVMLFYFIVLSLVVILVHLLYGEIALRTKGLHRLPGYVDKYFCSGGKIFSLSAAILGGYGALLAYLIVGGQFTFSLLSPIFGGSDLVYTLIYFFFGVFLVYFGIKSIAQIEFFALILFFAVLFLIFWRGSALIEIKNLFVFDKNYLFLPYGPILFSLTGIALMPEIKEMLKDNPKSLKSVVPLAIFVSALAYLFFIYLILGITGQNTSIEAIAGLKTFLGDGLVSLALFFGVLTTFTSFITLGLTLKKVFWYDLKFHKNLSWFLACFVPLALFFLGFKNFITIVGLTGGVMLGIDVLLILFVYLKAKTKGELTPAYSLSLPRPLIYFLILFFILGIIYEIIYFIK